MRAALSNATLLLALACGGRTLEDGLPVGGASGLGGASSSSGGSAGVAGIGVGGVTSSGGVPGLGGASTGGAPGVGGGVAGGAGGGVGGSAVCERIDSGPVLIDNLQDGDGALPQRPGGWFVVDDGTGMLSPPPDPALPFVPAQDPSVPGNIASRMLGGGHSNWGAILGLSFSFSPSTGSCPFDASIFSGIAFRARGTGLVRFNVVIPATQGPEGGGPCTVGCYDHYGVLVMLAPTWADYSFQWWELAQEGWGTRVELTVDQLLQLHWAVPVPSASNGFEVWIDDVRFVGGAIDPQ